MQTLQQKRHQELVAQLAKESQRRDDFIARLIRSDAKLQKLRRAIVRSSKRLADRPSMEVVAGINAAKSPPPAPAPAPTAVHNDPLDLGPFKRSPDNSVPK